MDYCAPKGIPHSVFLKWSDDDQDKALAWMLDREQVCSGCGTRADEQVGPDGRQLDPPAFVATATRCFSCQDLDDAREQASKDAEKDPTFTHGLKLYLRPFDPARDGGDDDPDDEFGDADG